MREVKPHRCRRTGGPPQLLVTQAGHCPFDVLESHDEGMRRRLKEWRNTGEGTAQPRLGHHIGMKKYLVRPGQSVTLAAVDPDDTHLVKDKEHAIRAFADLQARLSALQEMLFARHDRKVLVVLQGMDTAGKDGAIRHVGGSLNPQGIRVASFRQPTDEELDHDFLWRVHRQVPGKGEVVVFNRSHYEDVLVVRVHELVPKDVWKKRYEQINAFERMLSDNGTLILKFFLHIDKDEQRTRLEKRLEDPTKCWKFKAGDLKERELWNDYQRAYEDALSKTSTAYAPWHIVPANHKWYRDYVIGSILVDALEGLKLTYPKCDVPGVVVK
jgi:PPK2 family polyphosphate:nucleotide phosphotransferase